MAGFANVGEWADAADAGQGWIASYCKVPSAVATITGQWFDFSTAARNPAPNYYASEPSVAAVLEGYKGIYHGGDVAPASKYVHRWTTMTGASAQNSTAARNVNMILCDYLLYYPFLDMDAAGEDQIMENTVTLPRYADGEGVRIMAVAQAATLGGGQFTVTYTNQDGTPGRVTPNHFCPAAQPSGALVSATTIAAGVHPFLTLQAGDTGVRSIESVNFSLANGGLVAFVLVKPLLNQSQVDESRRTTSGTLESFGCATEIEGIRQRAGPGERVYDGAYLMFIGQATTGSVASAQFCGLLETVWG